MSLNYHLPWNYHLLIQRWFQTWFRPQGSEYGIFCFKNKNVNNTRICLKLINFFCLQRENPAETWQILAITQGVACVPNYKPFKRRKWFSSLSLLYAYLFLAVSIYGWFVGQTHKRSSNSFWPPGPFRRPFLFCS